MEAEDLDNFYFQDKLKAENIDASRNIQNDDDSQFESAGVRFDGIKNNVQSEGDGSISDIKSNNFENDKAELDKNINPLQKIALNIKSPDFSQILKAYDDNIANIEREKSANKKAQNFGILGDIGILIGDAIGAKGNANVNVRQGVTGKFNDHINKLDDIQRQYAARRPDLMMKIAMAKYQNDLGLAKYNKGIEQQDRMYALQAEKQKYDRSISAIKIQMAKEKDDNFLKIKLAQLEKGLKDTEENIRSNKAREGIGWANAAANKARASAYVANIGNGGSNKKNVAFEYVDPTTGEKRIVTKEKWDSNFPKLYRMIEDGISEKVSNGETLTKAERNIIKSLEKSVSEKEFSVKKYFDQYPEAAKYFEEISELSGGNSKKESGSLLPK